MKVLRAGGEYLQAREAKGWNALTLLGLAVFGPSIVLLSTIGRPRVVQLIAALSALFAMFTARAALPKVLRYLRSTREGRLGERLTAQLVSGLSDDYFLINDIVFRGGNIDHVIVGPCGVLAVETKRVAGDIRCDGDNWTVKGWPVRSYSKQAKAGATAVRALVTSVRPELGNEFVEAVVVLTHPHCRITINRRQVAVLRFSELLPYITTLATKRRMDRARVDSIVTALAGSWTTGEQYS